MKRIFFLVFIGCISANSVALDQRDPLVRDTLGFISDSATFHGQFFSVYNFCQQHVDPIVLKLSLKKFLSDNENLLIYQKKAENWIITRLQEEHATKEAIEGVVDYFDKIKNKAENGDKLYKDLLNKECMNLACSHRLGNMNSEGMQFKNLAKDSYNFMIKLQKEDFNLKK